MNKAICCAGFVLKGIGAALGLLLIVGAALGVPLYLTFLTSQWLDLTHKTEPPVFIVYVAIVVGGAIGAIRCWGERHE